VEARVEMSRRRVLVLPSWYPSNSKPLAGSFFQEQTRMLEREWDVRVMVPLALSTRRYVRNKPPPPGQLPVQDPSTFAVQYRTDRWMSWSRQQDAMAKAVQHSLAEFRREGWAPDVLLAHSTAWAGALATQIGKKLGLPVVIVEHSSSWLVREYTPEQESRVRQALADATTVCAVSPALRRLMLAHDLPDAIHWEVVGNLVDESVFYPPESSRTDGRADFHVLTVANREFIKDVRTLFQAVAIIKAQRPMLRLSLRAVGDFRGEGRSFSELSADYGVEDRVSIDSFLERAETAQAMREAHLFVSSSIAETFGVVIAEALACGLPVVATRSGGAEYILGEGSPFLVEPRDPEALARKMLEVVDGVHPFDALQASESIVCRFGLAAFAARMNRILNEAIRRHTSSIAAAPENDAGARL
jgi:glycosyltransferase involved in cell wall biosynthesis